MKHYGQNVQMLIKKAAELEDGPERDQATYIAAYYMKIALTSWASGQFVNEEMIRKDLYELSGKKLVLGPDVKIAIPGPNQPEQHQNGRKKNKKKKHNNRPNNQQNSQSAGNRNKNRRNKNRRR
jgi:hypothetical protein